jgi:hypothetical protein
MKDSSTDLLTVSKNLGIMQQFLGTLCNEITETRTDKKENKVFLIYKEILKEAVAKSYD